MTVFYFPVTFSGKNVILGGCTCRECVFLQGMVAVHCCSARPTRFSLKKLSCFSSRTGRFFQYLLVRLSVQVCFRQENKSQNPFWQKYWSKHFYIVWLAGLEGFFFQKSQKGKSCQKHLQSQKFSISLLCGCGIRILDYFCPRIEESTCICNLACTDQ